MISSDQNQQTSGGEQLKVPPKWLKRPCGATFGFGGKLVSFDYSADPAGGGTGKKSRVHISSVVTDSELITRSTQLETTMKNANFSEFCDMKIAQTAANCPGDEQVWKFIRANYTSDPRTEFLDLLDYDPVKIAALLKKPADEPANAHSLKGGGGKEEPVDPIEDLSNGMGDLHADEAAGLTTNSNFSVSFL